MKIDKLIQIIQETDLPQIHKNIFTGVVTRAKNDHDAREEDISLIESFGDKKIDEVVLSRPDVKIYKVYGSSEWDQKYPYRSIYLDKDGKWRRTSVVAPDLDQAYIVYLGTKYLGPNSRFEDFAMKMLEIPENP